MIRLVTPEDAPAIAELCRTSLGHSKVSADLLEKRIAEFSRKQGYYIAAYADDNAPGKTLGFIQAQRYELLYGGDGWNIIALAVNKEHFRRGIGRSLLKALEEYAILQGGTFIRLNSRIERTDAHAFYEHCGYSCDKTQKRYIRYLPASDAEG